jgi:Na+/pantothenate symporter
MAARASRIENQDAIDTAIVGILADPKEVRNVLSCGYVFSFWIFTSFDCLIDPQSFRFHVMRHC